MGILYLFKGLYNVLKEWKFETNSCHKVIIWMNMIKYLSTCIQDNYPYHIEGGIIKIVIVEISNFFFR